VTAIALSLGAALCWGVSDFGGGLSSRRVPVPVVLLWVEGAGLLYALAAVLIAGQGPPDARSLAFGAIGGLAGVAGLSAFYRALAIGTMSIVAPVSATGVTLPVIVGIATGNRIGAVVAVGLVVTFAGVLLASREEALEEERARASRTAFALALLSAVGFGCWFVFGDVAADGSVLWLLVTGRLAALPLLAAVLRGRRIGAVPPRRVAVVLCGCAAFDLGANGLYGLANTEGALAIVSVVGSLYPLTTVLLARLVLHERITPTQALGVAAAFVGVGMVSAG
jgi:drug/metabolite transporter (DMT)-like permease